MADSQDQPKLKRKREGTEPQRKKVKTQRKSLDAGGAENVPEVGAVVPARDQTLSKSALQKLRRKERKALRALKYNDNAAEESAQTQPEQVHTAATPSKGKEDASTKAQSPGSLSKARENRHKSSPWAVSKPFGGSFISQDPVFTSDDKFIILATSKALHIYATDSSLLSRTLPDSGFISAYALSASNPDHVYAANSTGLITLWDWTEGTKVARWDIESDVRKIEVVTHPESGHDLLFCHEAGEKHVINVHALRTREQGSDTELKRILKTPASISGLQVLLGGRLVVATTRTSILVGKRSKIHKTAIQDFEYVWRESKSSRPITSFSAHVQDSAQPLKGKSQPQSQRDHLNVAIGDVDGVIYLFEDILSSFGNLERNQTNSSKTSTSLEALKPRRLHWHRDAVGSIGWSQDGNYLISGGGETVLVLWQLSTGKQQHLPHLTAAIENIVVSPVGSSYAVTLANNSVIVLSTTELEAKTNIAGVQSRRVDRAEFRYDVPSNVQSIGEFRQVPLVVDPKNGGSIIFTTPSSQPRHVDSYIKTEPYIQTYDIATQRPVSKQAMTRNNTTDLNIRPDGGKVDEPNVLFLQISHDGQWLATIDEWVPPQPDMAFLDEGIPEFNDEEHTFRREIYLKFWRWDANKSQWALEARVDSPHFFQSTGSAARVFDLVSDPSSIGFATIGEDYFVRIWRPKTRMRDGTVIRGADGNNANELVTWSVEHSIELSSCTVPSESSSDSKAPSLPRVSRLAFSPDSSLLAVGVSFTSGLESSVVHLVEAATGSIRRSITELDVNAITSLGILGRHLIVISGSLSVWDLVVDEFVYSVDVKSPGLSRLAIDQEKGNFAIALPLFRTADAGNVAEASSKISVFAPHQQQALWSTTVSGVVLALAALRDGRGYIALDSQSSLRIVSPRALALQQVTPPPESNSLKPADARDISDAEDDANSSHTTLAANDLILSAENDKPVVRPEQLQEIFDQGPSQGLPPVKDLFNAVVGLYARKPRVVSAT